MRACVRACVRVCSHTAVRSVHIYHPFHNESLSKIRATITAVRAQQSQGSMHTIQQVQGSMHTTQQVQGSAHTIQQVQGSAHTIQQRTIALGPTSASQKPKTLIVYNLDLHPAIVHDKQFLWNDVLGNGSRVE